MLHVIKFQKKCKNEISYRVIFSLVKLMPLKCLKSKLEIRDIINKE